MSPLVYAPRLLGKGWGSPLLRAIGEALDDDRGCDVFPDGFVGPSSGPSVQPSMAQKEVITHAERAQRSGRVQGPWTRTAGPPARAARWTPRSAAPAGTAPSRAGTPILRELGGTSSPADRETVREVLRAYPRFQVRSASVGVWLTGSLRPIYDLSIQATLAVLVPHRDEGHVRAWAWWEDGLWIGPRHTNYADGSICSYEPRDGSWSWTEGLVPLMDMHAIWIARHLYLAEYGRWPGRQVLHTPIERLTEHESREFCGCGSDALYEECCRPSDLRLGLVRATVAGDARLFQQRRPILPG